jgi:hypothetical protein
MRTTYLYCVSIVSLVLSCNSNKHSDFININDHVPRSAKMQKVIYSEVYGDPLLMWEYEYKGNQFLLGTDRQNRIKYILDKDSSFMTPEGIRLGETHVNLEMIGKPIKEASIRGHYRILLPSGWIVQVEDGSAVNLDSDSIRVVKPKKTIVTIIFKM